MILENNNIDAIKSELSLLKTQFNDRINNLENRLAELTDSAVPVSNALTSASNNIEVAVVTPTVNKPSESSSPALHKAPAVNAYKEPPFIEVMIKTLFSMIFDWFKPVVTIYESYKSRGMVGIFVLTIAGIGLTLAGFGYLMQLLIDQLGSGAKSLLIFGAALGVMALGIGIKKKTEFNEFATAIVALGILLLYSTVYFAGSVYGVIPYMAVVTLYVIIALSSHVIALWLDTKIVAALGVVGIALMPMLSNIIVAQPSYYLISLALVTLSSVVIAYRYVGLWLAHLSLVFVLMALEWVINVDGATLSIIFIDLFYLIFFTYICLTLIKRNTLHKQSLLFLAALVGANLGFLFQATSLFSNSISIALIINTVVAVGASFTFFKLKHPLTHIMILVAAIWGILAVVSVISEAYWSIAWAVEGLFLLYLGRRYMLPMVINQGQTLTAVSLIACIAALIPYFPIPALLTIDGWALSLCMVAIIAIWLRLINDNESFNIITIEKIKPALMLIESVWLTILTLALMDYWLGMWTAPIVIIGQLALLLRARATQQTSIEIFAALLIFVPLMYVVDAGLMLDSYHFSALPLAAQCAVGAIFAQLWLFAEFYRRCQPDKSIESTMVKVAEWARIAFYLILPLFWLKPAIRHLEEYAFMLIWLSPIIALFLALKIKHVLIVWQAKILVGMASVLLSVGVVILPQLSGLILLGLFVACYSGAFLLNKRNEHSLYKFVYTFGELALGFALPAWILEHDSNMVLGLITAALYWGMLFYRSIQSKYITSIATFIYIISGLLILSSWILVFDNSFYALIPVIYIGLSLYEKEQFVKQLMAGSLFNKNGELLLHLVGVVTYVCLLAGLYYYRFDLLIAPMLAVHGALILFMKGRSLTSVKFSFGLIFIGILKLGLIDAENVLLWQKVMLFMGIGIFILGASFWYQKLIRTTDVSIDDIK